MLLGAWGLGLIEIIIVAVMLLGCGGIGVAAIGFGAYYVIKSSNKHEGAGATEEENRRLRAELQELRNRQEDGNKQ